MTISHLIEFKQNHYTDANIAYGKRATFVNEQEERDESSLTDGLTDPSDDPSCPSLSSTGNPSLSLDLGDTYNITNMFLHLQGRGFHSFANAS
jgi:hypothetical protein